MKELGISAASSCGLGDRAFHPFGAGGEDELGAERLEQVAPLDAHRVGHDEDHLVPFGGARRRPGAMPVLPLVGSMMTVSLSILPSRSAASIMARPMRSLTLPAGLKYSSLARPRRRSVGDAVESQKGRVADEIRDRSGDFDQNHSTSNCKSPINLSGLCSFTIIAASAGHRNAFDRGRENTRSDVG